MTPRCLIVAPQARRDMADVIAWYHANLGATAASKVARTLQAGVRATQTIKASAAARPDLPDGYFRVVAKAHLIICQLDGETSRVVRIIHGARDAAVALSESE